MAVTAGIMFGVNFCPVIYMQQNPEQFPTASSNGKPVSARYLLIDITGIYVAVYCSCCKTCIVRMSLIS